MSCVSITLNNFTSSQPPRSDIFSILMPKSSSKTGNQITLLYLTLWWCLITCSIMSKLLLVESKTQRGLASPTYQIPPFFPHSDPSFQHCAPILNSSSMLAMKMAFLHVCLFKHHFLCDSFTGPFFRFTDSIDFAYIHHSVHHSVCYNLFSYLSVW